LSDDVLEGKNNIHKSDRLNSLNEITTAYKVIRDPVHGDIVLNELETMLIDTPTFQRLHSMRQLGITYLLYPGANHTRFEHSIGTLHMTQVIIDAINTNPFARKAITDRYQVALARIAALLHDIGSIPFGNALDEEGNLFAFSGQWQQKESLLCAESEIGRILLKTVGQDFLDDVIQILIARNDRDIRQLRFPFIADMVKNGVCADLLDNLLRDVYYSGIKESMDTRFIRYVSIQDYGLEKGRLVFDLSPRGEMRLDVAFGIIEVLRAYYYLVEKVYAHPIRLAATAMLFKSIAESPAIYEKDRSSLLRLRDDELLYELEKNGSETSKYLISRLRGRKLHEPIYAISLDTDDTRDVLNKTAKELWRRFRNPLMRTGFERQVEERSDLPSGRIILYCPPLRDAKSLFKTRILAKGNVYALDSIPDTRIVGELDLLKKRSMELSKIFVFMDSDSARDKDTCLRAISACEKYLQIPSITDYSRRLQAISTPRLSETETIETLEHIFSSKGLDIVEERRLAGLAGYVPDIVAKKGNTYYIFEVKHALKPANEPELVTYLKSVQDVYAHYLDTKFSVLKKESSQEQIREEIHAILILIDAEPSDYFKSIMKKAGIGFVLLDSEHLRKISHGLAKANELAIPELD
jgi:HD superfamily phosphohydrolase